MIFNESGFNISARAGVACRELAGGSQRFTASRYAKHSQHWIAPSEIKLGIVKAL
jgi:hypothetical protein